jgi:hypothetical protein
VLGGGFYGLVMGTFGGFSGDRLWQPVYSGIKVPILLGVSFALGLPFFFMLNTLLGLRADFREALSALLKTQAAITLALGALAPYTAVWYLSTTGYDQSLLFNAAMFALASFTGQAILRRLYRPLIARHSRHRIALGLWLIIYAFVGIQMGWVLRPFVGDPTKPVRFFREGAFSNAYVVVAKLIWRVVMNSR